MNFSFQTWKINKEKKTVVSSGKISVANWKVQNGYTQLV